MFCDTSQGKTFLEIRSEILVCGLTVACALNTWIPPKLTIVLEIFRTDRGHNGLSIKTIDRSSPLPRNIETIDSSLSQDPACASLLPKADTDERYNNNLFGHFKGFTITPIKSRPKSPEPSKPAPPPPTIPTVAIKTNIKTVPKSNPARSSLLNSTTSFNEVSSIAPTLPPLNPGCTARPLISSPVLAATTCTSVELVAPKIVGKPIVDGPTRPAPAPPISADIQKPQRPSSTPLTNLLIPETEKKPEKGSTLNRIASMLRPSSGILKAGVQTSQKDEKNTNSLPRIHHHKANKVMDKEILRNLEISNPILQKEIEIPTPVIPVIPVADAERRNVVLRAQSMRDSKITPRPAIQTFGSMRQTTPVKRPTSIPASTRPTAPPPGPPIPTTTDKINETGKIPGLPGYQTPQIKNPQKVVDNAYDDCMNLISDSSLAKITEESPTNDNIYAVIEETLPEKSRKNTEQEKQMDNEYKLPKRVDSTAVNSGGLESMGLLSEIVSEISNRNFDSIYSTATLSRKAQENEGASKNAEDPGYNGSLGTYMNSSHYKSPGGSIYSNSASGKFNSSSSTTSSGYLNPSALNVPRQQPEKVADANKPKDKLLSLCGPTNANLNDEISKELGMKTTTEDAGPRKPILSVKTRPTQRAVANPKNEVGLNESKEPPKPPLGRTKTPPNIAKASIATKDANATRQGSDTASRSKQYSDSSSKKQGSNVDIAGQNSDARNQSNDNPEKQESHANVNRLSLKTVPCSPKDNGGKFNSPDLVSSCSNSNQISTKSPDVVGNNAKLNPQPKNVQKTPPTLSRGSAATKAPATPIKPSNIASKGTSLAEKKKSPTGNASLSKSLAAKESASKGSQPKPSPKTETKDSGAKTNPVQRAASSKSNVASLQQKFEANKNVNAPRTIASVHKTQRTVGKTETSGVKK